MFDGLYVTVYSKKKNQFKPNMIKYHGYPVEVHNVTTNDGYILQMHRITSSPNATAGPRKRPVLLVHGLADSSSTWVLIGPNRSIGKHSE